MKALELNNETSLFKGIKDKIPISVTMEDVFRLITGDLLKESTEKYRYFDSTGLKNDADREKRNSMCITPASVCKDGHAAKNMLTYTARPMVDFDDIDTALLTRIMEQLKADPYVLLAYITISGRGLRIIYQTDVTDAARHPHAYKQGNEYYARLLGLTADPKCKDVTRCSVLCKDPHAYFNPGADVMHIEVPTGQDAPKKKPGRPRKIRHAHPEMAEVVILQELGEQGKAYEAGRYNEFVSSALYLMNNYGVPEEDALQWAVDKFDDYNASEVASICHSVYQHREEHGTRSLHKQHRTSAQGNGEESYYATIDEMEAFISTQAEIRMNLLNHRREIRMKGDTDFRYLTDIDENTLWLRAKKEGWHTSNQILKSILNSEFIGMYHPLIELIEDLPQWDGKTDYIARLAGIVKTTDQEYFVTSFKKWFVAFVASLISPEIINHEILTFIGKEGIYKTTFFNRLLPPSLRSYFSTKISGGSMRNDDLLALSDLMLICLEEIDSMNTDKMNQIKATVTLPEVNVRAPYAHNREFRSHNSSFCATGNNRYFLPDGENRRWLIMNVLSIDIEQMSTIPYEGLYAQAIALYESGFRYWFDAKETTLITAHNEQFKEPNIEEELVIDHYRAPRPGEATKLVSLATILMTISQGMRYPLSRLKLRQALDKLGIIKGRTSKARGFLVVELTREEKKERESYGVFMPAGDSPQLDFQKE